MNAPTVKTVMTNLAKDLGISFNQNLYLFAPLEKGLIGQVSLENLEHNDYAILMSVTLYLHNYQCNVIYSTFSNHAGIWTKGLQIGVTQLYESYGLDANTNPVEPPESPLAMYKMVQNLVSTDRVLNLTEDVLLFDLPSETTQQSHTCPVQTSTPAREDTRSYHSYTPGLSSDKVPTGKKSATPATRSDSVEISTRLGT